MVTMRVGLGVALVLLLLCGLGRSDSFLEEAGMIEPLQPDEEPQPEADSAATDAEAEATPNVPLPEGWGGSASAPAPPADGAEPAAEEADPPRNGRERPRVQVGEAPLTPSSRFTFATPWGEMAFAQQEVYPHDQARGPAFMVKVPDTWSQRELKHEILGGLQHRYTAANGLERVVVVTFPLEEEIDFAAYLEEVQVRLLSSFKPLEYRRISLGRRSGLGAVYQGILNMRDVVCHLFVTRYKKKGYVVYGLYFDREGGERVSHVLHSVRIY